MTESEWDASDNPEEMLGWLYGSEKVPSERKLRLYYAACCRRMWDFFTSLSKVMVVFFEAHAESPRSNAERVRASDMIDVFTPGGQYVSDNQVIPLRLLSRRIMGHPQCPMIPGFVSARLVEAERGSLESNDAYHALLLRDVVGNPFRPMKPPHQAAWLALGGCQATVDISRAAYDDYDRVSGKLDPSRLKVLADALEESGCSESELLGHLRGPGPHVRGCWALDLILGKE